MKVTRQHPQTANRREVTKTSQAAWRQLRGSPAGHILLLQRAVGNLAMQSFQQGWLTARPREIQRTTPAEAELGVLRAAMMEAIEHALQVVRDQAVRQQLEQLQGRILTISVAELHSELPAIEQLAAQAVSTVTASVSSVPLTPRSAPPAADPLADPDTVVRERREYNLFRTIEFLANSGAIGAQNIRQMLQQMQKSLQDIVWYEVNTTGIVAQCGLTGSPQNYTVVMRLGPAAFMLMQNPNETMLPVLSHEIYHAYEQWRLQARGSLPARPNLSRTEMARYLQILSGTSASPGAAREALATHFVRYNESEIYAELVEHSALQDPTLQGSLPPGGQQLMISGRYQIVINSLTEIESEIQNRIELLRAIFGPQEGHVVAQGLLTRAQSEAWIHADTVNFFRRTIEATFP